MTMQGYLKSLGAVSLFGLLTFLVGADVFAQSTNTVEFTPLVDFGDFFTALITVVTPLIVGALTLAIGVWGTRWIWGMVKSFGRG